MPTDTTYRVHKYIGERDNDYIKWVSFIKEENGFVDTLTQDYGFDTEINHLKGDSIKLVYTKSSIHPTYCKMDTKDCSFNKLKPEWFNMSEF